jgi:hypothetical protein|tara:strand:- start:2559 stop:3158 length:600 start_codon:yes stop_codon:yes gene_type:complete
MEYNFVEVYDNAVDKQTCENIIKHFEEVKNAGLSIDRQSKEGVAKLTKDTDMYDLTETPDLLPSNSITSANDKIIFQTFKEAFWNCYNQYITKYDLTQTTTHTLDGYVKIQKTVPGQGYHVWHWEQDSVHHGHRLLLVMLYLNDVEEGGETEFLYQGIRVKPKQGSIMICPGSFTHTHRGNPPLTGEKYVMNTWAVYIN